MRFPLPRIASAATRRLKRRRGFLLAMLCIAGGCPMLCLICWPVDARRYLEPVPSGELLARDGRVLAVSLNADQQWCFVRPLERISPHLISATLAVEDRRFFSHPGVDPCALLRAAWQNLAAGRIVSGASTLPMQLAKLHNPTARRGWLAKLRQLVIALRLEAHADKTVLLTAYLNTAPYGQNVIGCEAAARRYFGKPAAELTLPEAALLAGLPKSPTGFAPLRRPEAALRRRNLVLTRMADEGLLSRAEAASASALPLGAAYHAWPDLARHVGQNHRAVLSGGTLRTTLDATMQARAELQLRRGIEPLRPEITNAAALIADPASGEILAWVGSADFWDRAHDGQVDVVRAVRSPGSALKPFIYASALDRQQLFPGEILCDAPLDFGLYAPQNIDRHFRGLVSAADALRRSLNIPALTVLERTGVAPALAMLRSAGLVTGPADAQSAGLGLALGNIGVRLDELTGAYALLANLGAGPALHLTTASLPLQRELLPPSVAVSLYSMLEQPLPGESDARQGSPSAAPRVAWKTGTSTGRRDAWAFVFNRQYVVGVWVGNNSGRGTPALFGSKVALPLAGQIFRSLPVRNTPSWPDAGALLRPVSVCAVSGLPAGPACTERSEQPLPQSAWLLRTCQLHRLHERREVWPASARHWDLARATAAAPDSPAMPTAAALPASDEGVAQRGLKICTPAPRSEFLLSGLPDGDRIRLATSLDATTPLHWYLNELYLGPSSPQAPLILALTPGRHTLACATDSGLVDTTTFIVSEPE